KLAPLVLLTLLTWLYIFPAYRELGYALVEFSPWKCFSHLETAGCVSLNKDQEQAVEYIKTHTDEDEPIFVGNQQHDRIVVNDVGFYFLANRPNASRYAELFPGVVTTLEVQKEIVQSMKTKMDCPAVNACV
ncbi:MAG: hypothetical protein M1282_10020, partial [Chloroflexi bacterium]|nr:hypothetical protein [Chloroflexota bacterium]